MEIYISGSTVQQWARDSEQRQRQRQRQTRRALVLYVYRIWCEFWKRCYVPIRSHILPLMEYNVISTYNKLPYAVFAYSFLITFVRVALLLFCCNIYQLVAGTCMISMWQYRHFNDNKHKMIRSIFSMRKNKMCVRYYSTAMFLRAL